MAAPWSSWGDEHGENALSLEHTGSNRRKTTDTTCKVTRFLIQLGFRLKPKHLLWPCVIAASAQRTYIMSIRIALNASCSKRFRNIIDQLASRFVVTVDP